MCRSGQHPLFFSALLLFVSTEVSNQLVPVEFAVEAIHIGNLLLEFFSVAFGETAHDIDCFEEPLFFLLTEVQNHFDALFFGICNESTRVHNCRVAVQGVGIMEETDAMFLKAEQQPLGVHQILGAPHGDEVYCAHVES